MRCTISMLSLAVLLLAQSHAQAQYGTRPNNAYAPAPPVKAPAPPVYVAPAPPVKAPAPPVATAPVAAAAPVCCGHNLLAKLKQDPAIFGTPGGFGTGGTMGSSGTYGTYGTYAAPGTYGAYAGYAPPPAPPAAPCCPPHGRHIQRQN